MRSMLDSELVRRKQAALIVCGRPQASVSSAPATGLGSQGLAGKHCCLARGGGLRQLQTFCGSFRKSALSCAVVSTQAFAFARTCL